MTELKTLLIANRGEIALRVMRTAHALGIATVAIFTELDRESAHVAAATRAVEVPSYLDIDAIVTVAKDTATDAVHPGYGFLSERADFARALETAGLKLVGPSGDVMDQMGRKDRAREIAVAAGVPVVPSFEATSAGAVADMPFPILVKAAAGGGGKGMRIVRSADEYDEAVAAAAREAAKAFGDDTLLIEKYVEHGRHIEVQVMADSHGNVVHFFERDCSTQRRHQKVLEEAPAPTISEDVRRLITESAVALAQQVGYENAGTVEFLLDSDTEQAYFLEMNTRLQVEHPVTELVTRIGDNPDPVDLVAIQLRVAAGEALAFGQVDISLHGHAIEARVYAEDSFNGFLPQAGTAHFVQWPDQPAHPWARVDAALTSGQVISTSFDPMLGKVISWGENREQARQRLVLALDHTVITGLTTNTGFLRTLLAGDEFREATIDTAWLDRNDVPVPASDVARSLAALALAPSRDDVERGAFSSDGWRLAGAPAPTFVQLDRVVAVRPGSVDGIPAEVVDEDPVPGDQPRHTHSRKMLTITMAGATHHGMVARRASTVEVVHQGQRFIFELPDPFADHGPVAGDGTLLAPMPGTVLDVRVVEGQAVVAGEILGVMEAMKMEHSLKAPYDGTVTTVGAATGDQVALGALLFEVSEVTP